MYKKSKIIIFLLLLLTGCTTQTKQSVQEQSLLLKGESSNWEVEIVIQPDKERTNDMQVYVKDKILVKSKKNKNLESFEFEVSYNDMIGSTSYKSGQESLGQSYFEYRGCCNNANMSWDEFKEKISTANIKIKWTENSKYLEESIKAK